MPLIRPFAALRPIPRFTDKVIAPPYDVLNSEEARVKAQNHEWSFLHISKPEIDLPTDTDPYSDAVYAKGAGNLQHYIDQQVLKHDPKPFYYLYGLKMGEHEQLGIVAAASITDYDSNRIRKHELTRPDKEDDRVRHIDTLNAQTGPVFLVHKYSEEVAEIIKEILYYPPIFNVTADDGVEHKLWIITDPVRIDALSQAFDKMDYLYIADGHHRSAAASRVAAQRKASNENHTGDEAYNYFLSVIFPDNQVQILDYNRVIRDLNGLSKEEFLQKLAEYFTVQSSPTPVKPAKRGEFGMFLGTKWYRLTFNQEIPQDPVARLDVSLLANYLIEPILGINDPRRDKRIDFVGGIRGLGELEKRVKSGEMAVAFSLFPTPLADLLAVADAEQLMPPKSTWFEPKLADGIVSHWLGDK